MIDTYLVRRPSLIGTTVRRIDEPVPEAHLWRLTDGMVRHGRLRQVQMSEADFAAAVSTFCPDEADAIYAKLGLEPLVVPDVRRGRVRGKRTVLLVPPVPIDVKVEIVDGLQR